MIEFLPCTACGATARYIGTTAGGRVWLAYEGEDVAEVEAAFLRRVRQVGLSDPLTEFNGVRSNGLRFDCSSDEFLENRVARLDHWGFL
jgi:hypothetical protein